jgi:hypothetical protein
MQLSKTCATMYVAGAGCKFVNKQVGQDDTALVGAVTEDLWQLNALAAAIATAMFSLGETGFDGVKMTAAIFLGALALKLNDSGANVDTVRARRPACLPALSSLVPSLGHGQQGADPHRACHRLHGLRVSVTQTQFSAGIRR